MQNRYDKCPNCMQALGQGEDVCPYCGFDVSGYEEKPNCLRPFTVLQMQRITINSDTMYPLVTQCLSVNMPVWLLLQ